MRQRAWCSYMTASDYLKCIRNLVVALLSIFFTGPSSSVIAQPLNTNFSHPSALTRHYQEGELLAYTMQATNQDHRKTIHYETRVEGRVKRDLTGAFVEEFSWKMLNLNGQAVPFTTADAQLKQGLSLSPDYKLTVPDLSKVQPILIGPIVDLLTFYADVQLAMRQRNLVHPGDHVYVKYGLPNSWADGTYTIFGQDAIDFDITLAEIDEKLHVAKLFVRHVPPEKSPLQLPAAWMQKPINTLPNNWAEVEKDSENKYLAEVGQETFAVSIKLELPSGRILSATMENPTNVLERNCEDAALSNCGPAVRYQIRRRITLEAVKAE